MSEVIEHQGFIERIDATSIWVNITQASGCGACSANSSCNMAETEEKLIEVFRQAHQNYQIGDSVRVFYAKTLGFRALAWGYIYPFLLLFFVLIVVQTIVQSELIAGLSALSALIPYYGLLYLFRKHFRETYRFQLEQL